MTSMAHSGKVLLARAIDILKDDEHGIMSQWSKRNQKPLIIVASACEVGTRAKNTRKNCLKH